MYLKILGGIMIIAGCGGFGFRIAFAERSQFLCLKQLQQVLDFMQCELQYHLTPLPELCREAAKQSTGKLRVFWLALIRELEDQISPEVSSCVNSALAVNTLPDKSAAILRNLGSSLGRFDLEGQINALEGARQACRMQIQRIDADYQIRQRSCQTLGLCAGAALAILLL